MKSTPNPTTWNHVWSDTLGPFVATDDGVTELPANYQKEWNSKFSYGTEYIVDSLICQSASIHCSHNSL